MQKYPRCTLVIPIIVLLLAGLPAAWSAKAPSTKIPSDVQKHFARAAELQKAGKIDAAIAEIKIVKKMAPGRIEPVMNLSLLYLQKKDLANAESALKQVLDIDPKNGFAIEQMAKVLFWRNKDSQALTYARKLVDLKPKDFGTRFLFGAINLKLRNYESALDAFKTTAHMRPDDVSSLYNLGYCYLGMKRYSDAVDTLDRIIKQRPDEGRALLMAAYAAEQMGDKTAAIKYYEIASNKSKDFSITALGNLARIYDASGNKEKSNEILKRLAKLDKNNLQANLRLAKVAADKGDLKEAETRYLAAKTSYPGDLEIIMNLAIVQVQLKKLDDAQANVAAAAKIAPKNPKVLEVLSYVQEMRGKLDSAIATYKNWQKCAPKDPTPNARLGNIYAFQRKNDLAYKEFEAGLKKDPKDLETLESYARALGQGGDFAKAYDMYEQAMKVKPGVAQTMLAAAYCLEMQKKYDDSIALLKKAADVDPKAESTYFAMGRIYEAQKKDDAAIDTYKKVLEISPKSTMAPQVLAALYDKNGKYEDEIEMYRKLKSSDSKTDPYTAMAIPRIYAEKLNKLDKAIEESKKLVESDSKNMAYRNSLANYLMKNKEYAAAIEQYTEMTKDPDAGMQSDAYRQIGAAQEQAGKIDEAIGSYKKSLSIRADLSTALDALKKVYDSQQKPGEFIAYIKTLVEQQKADMPYRYFWDTYKAAGKSDEAIKTLEDASRKDPENPQIATVLGSAYADTGRKEQAVDEYKKVISKNPDDPRTNRTLGYLYKSMGRDVDAAQCLAKAAEKIVMERPLLLDLAGLYEKLGKKPEALAVYKNYMKVDPANQEIRKKVFAMENPGIVTEPAKPAQAEPAPAK